MPILHSGSEAHSSSQKLSKIETLRLARNYILAMSQTLQEGKPMDVMRFAKILSRELSQTTANLLNGSLMGSVNNSLVVYRRYLNNDYPGTSALQECSNLSYHHVDWQEFNGDCSVNSHYNVPWYQNCKHDSYKYGGNGRYESSFRYVETESCFYEGYSKQMMYSEW